MHQDPEVLLLQRRGHQHEKRYIDYLLESDRAITNLSASQGLSYEERAAETVEHMRRGDDVIYQGMVFDGAWIGYPDFLLRVPARDMARTDSRVGLKTTVGWAPIGTTKWQTRSWPTVPRPPR